MDTATTEIYTLSLHDALPICGTREPGHGPSGGRRGCGGRDCASEVGRTAAGRGGAASGRRARRTRSEEHTSELQSRFDLVCRLLLEKKNLTITLQRTSFATVY